MSDPVGDVSYAIHQVLDAIEHAVDVAVEPCELILHTGDRDSPSEVARLYFASGAPDCTDAMLELPTKHQSAADCEQQRHRSTRQEGMPYQLLHLLLVLHVAPDDEKSSRPAKLAAGDG